VQFFLPGVPQVYYVGLLAGHNDMDLLARSGVGRDINRHHYSRAEVQTELQRPVVRELVRLIKLRNTAPAFQGSFKLNDSASGVLDMAWQHGEHGARLVVDFATLAYQLELSSGDRVDAFAFAL